MAAGSILVDELPPCDTHDRLFPGERPRKAKVDGKTVYGPWANMCFKCHDKIGVGFGTGRGQRLLLRDEKAPS